MKKKVTKSKSAKSTKMAKVQELRDGFRSGTKKNPLPHFKYLNCAVSDIGNEKFPEMVQITMGPAKIMNEIGGKRYVNESYARLAIDEVHGFSIVDKGKKSVEAELESIGILPTDGHSLVETLI